MSRLVLFAAAVMALAAPAHAQVLTVDLKPLAAAPAERQATAVLKGGAICAKQGPLTGAEIGRAFTTGQADASLREELSKAGVMVNGAGFAAVGVAGAARISQLDACLPNYGFASMDAISGKVEVAVDWTLTDRATGAEIGQLSTRELVERKGGSGGLAGLVNEALAANARSLAANPALRAAAARPLLASARPEPSPPRDPALLVLPPWRQSTQKAPLAVAAPLIVESDLDMIDNLDQSEHFAVPLEAGETLRLEVLETGSKIAMVVANPGNRYIAGTHPRNPERQLSATAKTAGTYVVSAWTSGDPPVTPYRLKIDTDRRPYQAWTPPPRPPAPATGPSVLATQEQVASKPPVTAPAKPVQPAPQPQPHARPQPPAPLAPLPKLVPPPGVLAAEIGKPVNRPAGKVGAAVDLFAFIGEAGSVLQVTSGAAGAGGLSVTLYTPEGDRMLDADGVDNTGLSAILPKDGVYLLSVGRQNAARPYRLNLAAERPDIFQWSFRENAGYEILGPDGKPAYWTCWAAPGSALTYVRPGGREATLRVSAGGDGHWDLADAPDYSFTTALTGGVFIRTSSTGKLETWSIRDEKTTGAYRGYFCP
ncbi:hypothetical protein [Caulobacter endophyticus]|uniref:Pre-peptidase C-terminal domain-containing protein n=1 Tax=Caulobacter endophyticus TaxID=2172652 RepID=A0A2T9K2V5_9CAUL|nr:hypothetical protein [Caulobacter endophyticus]PVM90308.1 hypothetical protein DDF67_10295 [Caulobacter endophyticus]